MDRGRFSNGSLANLFLFLNILNSLKLAKKKFSIVGHGILFFKNAGRRAIWVE